MYKLCNSSTDDIYKRVRFELPEVPETDVPEDPPSVPQCPSKISPATLKYVCNDVLNLYYYL